MIYIIADMNPTPQRDALQRKIKTIQQALRTLGPMHPGSLSRQYQVCGRAGCRCMNPEHPHRHGPYHKLSYVHRGKPVCRFVRAACVTELTRRLATYKTFRKLIDQWIELSIQQGQVEFFTPPTNPKPKGTHRTPAGSFAQKKPHR